MPDLPALCPARSPPARSPGSESEVERIARVAYEAATKRGKRLCSVEKSNVLEVSQLWREVVTRVGADYPEVELSHM